LFFGEQRTRQEDIQSSANLEVILPTMNDLRQLVCRTLLASAMVWPVGALAQSESAGVGQYFNNCASCHESTDASHQAPKTSVLKQMTPEHVLDVLTNGSMRSNAAALSDGDKRLIAEWVGGRKIDNDSIGAAEKMTNTCATHPPLRESSGPAWNGWGADLRNTRSQTAVAAGLTPAQVSRLQLKWAFGFPGATALYAQTVYDGRLYVSSNAGYVYSLDAKSGCLHWAFRAQAAVRSSFTIGRLSRTNAKLGIFLGISAAQRMRSMPPQAH
jgi:polyvinyl alcohol dehydrogenase (cytochrome)